MSREIIIQSQDKLSIVEENCKHYSKSGFTAIQIGPIQPCKLSLKDDIYEDWWKLYQPYSFEIGNPLGNKKDLINLCKEAHKYNLKVVVDIVLRHVASDDFDCTKKNENVSHNLLYNKYFWSNAQNINNYNDRWQCTHLATGMPMLDYWNYDLQDLYIKFMDELISCGVDGFRLDQGKHYCLPFEDKRCHFWQRVFGRYKDKFNYAECIQCDKWLLDKYSEYINVLTDKEASDKSKMVIYVESHDSYLNNSEAGYTKNMEDSMLLNEYENMLKYNKYSNILFYERKPIKNRKKTDFNLYKSEIMSYINHKYI